ncbi:MAG: type II toxin-antitoxin system VapC family toxin [Coriobacteriales bacterium]
MFFLDSDICINLMRGKLPTTYAHIRNNSPEIFGIPAAVEAELRCGATKSNNPVENLLLLERFLTPFTSVPFDRQCAIAYGRIRADLEQRGMKIGPNDLFIAATAFAHGAILVTGNTREFGRIDGLVAESWDEVELD